MRSFALILCAVLAAGCDEEQAASPEAAARHAECRQLFEHAFRLMPPPGTSGALDAQQIAALVDRLPVEDFAQCAAIKDRSVIACMRRAPDEAALRACIPEKKD